MKNSIIMYYLISIVFIPANLVSFYQYFTLTHYYVSLENGAVHQGIVEGRLFGVFGSPHFAGLFMLLLTIASLYFAIKAKSTLIRILCISFAIIYYAYAALSGTRSIIVGSACVALVVFFCWIYNKLKTKQNIQPFLRYVICIVTSICITICTIITPTTIASVGRKIYSTINQYTDTTSSNEKNESDIEVVPESDLILNRSDINSENISNHRFEIWRNYFDVTTQSVVSLLFGNSPGNYMTYIRNNYPDVFIVEYIKSNYPLMYKDNLIYDTHNAYVSAFATTGVLGLILLLSFLLYIFIRTLKYLFSNQNTPISTYAIFSIWILILISSFFESDLFFKCTSTSVIFWLFSGALIKTTSFSTITKKYPSINPKSA